MAGGVLIPSGHRRCLRPHNPQFRDATPKKLLHIDRRGLESSPLLGLGQRGSYHTAALDEAVTNQARSGRTWSKCKADGPSKQGAFGTWRQAERQGTSSTIHR